MNDQTDHFADSGAGDDGAVGTMVRPERQTATKTATERPWLWHVVLHDSEEHSYEYVIELLSKVFGHSPHKGFALARMIDSEGKGVVLTTHRELAELKAEQVRSFGPDARVASCRSPLRVTLEPAESD